MTEGTEPIPMIIWCPVCRGRHIDEGEFATRPHHTHSCQFCGLNWRPALVPTVGVRFLPGFRNDTAPTVLAPANATGILRHVRHELATFADDPDARAEAFGVLDKLIGEIEKTNETLLSQIEKASQTAQETKGTG